MLKEKKAAKAKKKGKKGEVEAVAEAEDDASDKAKEPAEQKLEEVKYALGEMYDKDVAEVNKLDYELEQLLSKAKVKALKTNDMKVFDLLQTKKMSRREMRAFLNGKKEEPQEVKESMYLKDLNKEWQGLDLDNRAYGEFWKDNVGIKRPIRASQSVKRSR